MNITQKITAVVNNLKSQEKPVLVKAPVLAHALWQYEFPENDERLAMVSNTHFVGFNRQGQPIIDSTIAHDTSVKYKGKEIHLSDEYAWVGVDEFDNPVFENREVYQAEVKQHFIDLYTDYYVSPQNASNVYDKYIAKDVNNYGADQHVIAGLAHDFQPLFVALNTGCYIVNFGKYGEPIWNKDLTSSSFYITRDKNSKTPMVCYTKSLASTSVFSSIKVKSEPATVTSSTTAVKTHVKPKTHGGIKTYYYPIQSTKSKEEVMDSMFANLNLNNATQTNVENVLLKNHVETFDSVLNNDTYSMLDVADWNAQNAFNTFSMSLVGESHIMTDTPCQDSSTTHDRPNVKILVVSDGAGSAPLSHFGSRALVDSTKRFIVSTHELVFQELLDTPLDVLGEEKQKALESQANQLITKHAIGTLMDLAQTNNRNLEDYFGTLLLVVMGKQNTYWYRVGDGGLIVQYAYTDKENPTVNDVKYTWKSLNDVSKSKGSFANETYFICKQLTMDMVQSGVFTNDCVSSIAIMTDGLSERVISKNEMQISETMNAFTNNVLCGKMDKVGLYNFVRSNEFRNNFITNEDGSVTPVYSHNGDDCTLAILSRKTLLQWEIEEQERKEQERLKAEEEERKRLANLQKANWWSGNAKSATSSKKSSKNATPNPNGNWSNLDDLDYFDYSAG